MKQLDLYTLASELKTCGYEFKGFVHVFLPRTWKSRSRRSEAASPRSPSVALPSDGRKQYRDPDHHGD